MTDFEYKQAVPVRIIPLQVVPLQVVPLQVVPLQVVPLQQDAEPAQGLSQQSKLRPDPFGARLDFVGAVAIRRCLLSAAQTEARAASAQTKMAAEIAADSIVAEARKRAAQIEAGMLDRLESLRLKFVEQSSEEMLKLVKSIVSLVLCDLLDGPADEGAPIYRRWLQTRIEAAAARFAGPYFAPAGFERSRFDAVGVVPDRSPLLELNPQDLEAFDPEPVWRGIALRAVAEPALGRGQARLATDFGTVEFGMGLHLDAAIDEIRESRIASDALADFIESEDA